jgi:hypothetical protein
LADRFRLPLDQARLRPHLRGRAELGQQQANVLRDDRATEAGVDVRLPHSVPTGDDWLRRRGLPMIGRGVAGATPGSNPVAELIRKDERRRLRG